MRTMLKRLVLALLLVLIPAGVHAGGWSVVTLDKTPAEVKAGTAFTIGFTVLQHGETPVDGLTPKITFTSATGDHKTFTARGDGARGHYVADLTLPTAGAWAWEIEAFGPPSVMSPLQVLAAPAAAPAPASPAVAPALAMPTALPWGGAAIVVIALACAVLFLRRRPARVEA
jgi:hypothetical protein